MGVLCSAASLLNGLTYDDVPIIQNNPRIRELSNLRAIWLTDWWGQPSGDSGIISPDRDRLYRPLTMFTFALNYAAGGLAAWGYHAANIALHGLCCSLLWWLARRLLDSNIAASVAALLFAVHPVHAEAIAGIVGRAELLSAALLLAGLLCLLPPSRLSLVRTAAASLAFLAALLSKETAICYPVVALLVVAFARRASRANWRWWAARGVLLLAPLAIYFPLRYVALGGHLVGRSAGASVVLNPLRAADVTATERAVGVVTILGEYTRLLLAPVRLSCDYGLATFDPHAGITAITLLGFASLAALLIALARWRSRVAAWRSLALCGAGFVASYALISNAPVLIGVSLAERLIYWPSAWFALLVGAGAASLCACVPPVRMAMPARLGVVLLVALGLRLVVRIGDWYDNATLFAHDARQHPENVALNTMYAQILLDHATQLRQLRPVQLDQARRLLDRALAIMPRLPDALRERGRLALLSGDRQAAVTYLAQAVQINPTDAHARRLLAEASGLDTTRIDALRAAVARDPADIKPRLELGRLLLATGQNAAALETLQQAARLAPDDPDVLMAQADALAANDRQAEARAAYERVIRLRPDDWRAHTNLAGLLAETDPQQAVAHAERARALRPNDWRTAYNLAEAYVLVGRRRDAVRLLNEAQESLPPEHPARAVVAARIRGIQRQPNHPAANPSRPRTSKPNADPSADKP